MEMKKLIEFLDENLSKSKDEEWNDVMFGQGWMAALMHVKVNFAELNKDEQCVPYQLCPKCNGTGQMWLGAWDGHSLSFLSSGIGVCDVCNGTKIIPMYKIS